MNRLINLALLLAIVVAVVASFGYLGLDLAALGQADNLGHMADYAARFLQPDLSSGHLLAIGRGALETLAMSALGTLLAALLGLAGCNGNYKSSDDEYRPLGDPHAQQQRDD